MQPLLGVGPGNFRYHYFEPTGRPVGTQNLDVVHNAYLDVAAELGFLGDGALPLATWSVCCGLTGKPRPATGPPGYAAALRRSRS